VVAVNAALKLLVHAAKTEASADRLGELQAQAEQTVDAVVAEADAFTGGLLLSRYYRAAAFVPQRQGLRNDVVRMMDLAEQYAASLIPSGDAQELLYLENLHPVLESRTKEALWLGDLDLALARARRVVDLDPYDPKTWLELGQVRLRRREIAEAAESYAVAATLGPPASAIARHMAGTCYRDLGQPMLAGFFFKEAAEIDRRSISPHDEIQILPDVPVIAALKAWSLRSFVP
jgi:tetratricopeptide (TPR) repeat protein